MTLAGYLLGIIHSNYKETGKTKFQSDHAPQDWIMPECPPLYFVLHMKLYYCYNF